VGCRIDVKEEKPTFDVGEHHAEFGLFKDFESSPSTFSCCGCEISDSDEPMDVLDMTLNDPSNFECPLFEGYGLNGVTVDSMPPNIIEDRPYAVDEGYLSSCCRFVILWMSIPPISGGVPEVDANFKLDIRPFDGSRPRMTVFLDPFLRRTTMFKKDLNPELLRWVLLVHQF